ncbi:hypothetical protein DPMN_100972 [Dreissena polymorpha]|uniref:C-type lectin domain-containing protein n=1 Tax=Dreissena polymorpha TaxID=45954 RepID=A0A9D4LI90_DREPO|nr:hypothetical protein DPMN_100972 [Dreissena polymorpha]
MSSLVTKLVSLNEVFNRRLEGVKLHILALPDFAAKINKSEADFDKRSRSNALSVSSLVGNHGKSINITPGNAMDYNLATKVCSDIGGYLVEINSEEENEFIKNTFYKNWDIYIGGSDGIIEGNWEWAHSGDRIPMRNQEGL